MKQEKQLVQFSNMDPAGRDMIHPPDKKLEIGNSTIVTVDKAENGIHFDLGLVKLDITFDSTAKGRKYGTLTIPDWIWQGDIFLNIDLQVIGRHLIFGYFEVL